MHSLTIFIPGLFLSREDISSVEPPSTPSLRKILSCSQHKQLVPFTFTDALSMLFRINKPEGDYPLAAISRLVDDEQEVDGFWMRADPVHLYADQSGLILMDDTAFILDQHDALVLAADIRELFTEHGLELEAPTTHRWYVRLENEPRIVTTPIHEVTGRDIHHYLPRGENSAFWIRLMNEVQMVMHDNAINRRREADNEKSVNSVWFWGAGELPASVDCPWTCLFTDDYTSQGMARLAGIDCHDLPDSLSSLIRHCGEDDDVLVVLSFGLRHRQYHDINGWLDFIGYLEEFWFDDVEENIRSGVIKQLTLLTEYQQFDLNRMSLLKFWRRKLPVLSYAG